MSNELELTVTRTIPASRQAVFDAWLDPAALAAFIRPVPGMPAPTVETDPVVGGAFRIVMQGEEREFPHHGEYKQIDRYDRIVFTWISEYTAPDSTVTLSFKELGPSETELTLHHVGFASPEARDNHQGGWGTIVETLSATVA